MEIDSFAKKLAGNHLKFDSFALWQEAREMMDPPEDWGIIHTHTRDSTLMEESNAHTIAEALKPFLGSGDLQEAHFSHWACGWVDGYLIRVFKDGKLMPALEKYYELHSAMEDYPVLDEEDYSKREYDATIENIKWEGRDLVRNRVPKDWAEQVFSWLFDNNQEAVESQDDQGGYPTKDNVLEALKALRLAKRAA